MRAWLKRLAVLALLIAATAGAVVLYAPDRVAALVAELAPSAASGSDNSRPAPPKTESAAPPAVTVTTVAPRGLVSEARVTGTLVARDEVLVAPQVEGQRIVALLVEEGQRVAKGDLLARLVSDNIDAQLAQNAAAIARAEASIAQARSAIVQADARLKEAQNAYARAVPLSRDGYMPTSTLETREAAATSARAAVATARDGLAVSEAEKRQAEAQRREIEWRRDNTEIRAPAAGIVSRRTARVGAMASAQSEPMFRIVADGIVELDAEVPEAELARIEPGQPAVVAAAGGVIREARVRLVSPEVDRSTRLGRVRLAIGDMADLKIGGFARATIKLAERRGLAVLQSAVMYDAEGPYVLAVEDGRARTRRIALGIVADGYVEVTRGLDDGASVVARAGTFLRDGDAVSPVPMGGTPTVTTGAIPPSTEQRRRTGALR